MEQILGRMVASGCLLSIYPKVRVLHFPRGGSNNANSYFLFMRMRFLEARRIKCSSLDRYGFKKVWLIWLAKLGFLVSLSVIQYL